MLYSERHHGCRASEYIWRGHRLVTLENEQLRVGVVASKGADIIELRYKPMDLDFLWHSPHPLLPTAEYIPSSATSLGSFFDHYHGGWQESLPAGNGSSSFAGAQLGLHGEVATMPWDVVIEDDRPQRIAVRFSVHARRTPFRLDRTMVLERQALHVRLDEALVNEGEEPVPFVWGHHVSFGSPFISQECVLDLPAAPVVVPEGMPHGRYRPGRYERWPALTDRTERQVDAHLTLPKEARVNDTLYLYDLEYGGAAVHNPQLGIGVGLEWDPAVFPYLWSWQAYGGAWGYPYYGRAYQVALEPFNAPICTLEDAVNAGTARFLAPGEQVVTTVRAGAVTDEAPFRGFHEGHLRAR